VNSSVETSTAYCSLFTAYSSLDQRSVQRLDEGTHADHFDLFGKFIPFSAQRVAGDNRSLKAQFGRFAQAAGQMTHTAQFSAQPDLAQNRHIRGHGHIAVAAGNRRGNRHIRRSH
jgi:hypothetical protein